MPRRLVSLLAILVTLAALAGLPSTAAAGPRPGPGADWRSCNAVVFDNGQTKLVPNLAVLDGGAERRGYPRATTSFLVQIRHGRCQTAWALLRDVLAAPDESAGLLEGGFRLRHVDDVATPARLGSTYRVWASHRRTWVRYLRFGRRPRVDTALYRAGQHLLFYVSGVLCTAGYVLRIQVGGAPLPVGLAAGHCSNFPAFGGLENEAPIRQRPSDEPPLTTLGLIVDNGFRRDGPDALTFAFGDDLPGVVQEIERGVKTPLAVTGWLPTARQDKGVEVCFAGRVSGADGNCGKIFRFQKVGGERLICARTKARHGDSGGPVFLPPDGRQTEAVGIVKGARLNFPPLAHGELCYTPIETILDEYHATFPIGLVTLPGAPGIPTRR